MEQQNGNTAVKTLKSSKTIDSGSEHLNEALMQFKDCRVDNLATKAFEDLAYKISRTEAADASKITDAILLIRKAQRKYVQSIS